MNRLSGAERCLECWRFVVAPGPCFCGGSFASVGRQGARSFTVGLLGLVENGERFDAMVSRAFDGTLRRPERAPAGRVAWTVRGQASWGSVWFWGARLDELPVPLSPPPRAEGEAARLRALRGTDVLLVELPPSEGAPEAVAFRGALSGPLRERVRDADDVVAALCALLDELGGAPKQVVFWRADGAEPAEMFPSLAARGARMFCACSRDEALAKTFVSLRTTIAHPARQAPARDRVDVDELGGVAARELLSHLHAAAALQSGWRPGALIPKLVPVSAAVPVSGGLRRGARLVGIQPTREALLWGSLHARRRVSPALADLVPSWTARVRSRFGWASSIPFLPVWKRELDEARPQAVTWLGVGSDASEGERRLDALLEAHGGWTARPIVLLRHRHTSERLWRVACELCGGAATFEIPDAVNEPWREPAALLAPVLRALVLTGERS